MYKINKRNFIISNVLFVTSLFFPNVGLPYKKTNLKKIIKSNKFDKNTSFMAVDLSTNKIIERFNEDLKLPIASVTKMITAQYMIQGVNLDYRFLTDFYIDGVQKNGILEGDVYIKGYGDPTLTTDNLYDIVKEFKKAGIEKITGSLFFDDTYLPSIMFINEDQLPQYAYNPGLGALNLNENRILFKWKKNENSQHDLNLSAKGIKANANVSNINVNLFNKVGNVYKHSLENNNLLEVWSVNKRILGKKGSRWLPVRNGSLYTAEVLRNLLYQNGIVVKGIKKRIVPSGLKVFRSHSSKKISEILIETLRHSKNMISEVLGLQTSRRIKGKLDGLEQSGLLMTKWFRGFIKSQSSLFFNHSGLTAGSFSTASDFRKFLIKKEVKRGLTPLLKTIPIYTKKGRTNALGNISVKGKSGTMHYIRGLSGYICVNNEPRIAFAIFSADLIARKENFSNKFEKPKGASPWLSRAVIQERRIVRDLCLYLKSD